MNKKGFTLIELLGVIIILAIIMLIAVPNISSTLERSKRDNYIADANKFVSLVEYELRKGTINKPASNELVKISLSYLGTNDIKNDPNGDEYSKEYSYVVVSREDGYLVYYVNLIAKDSNNNFTKGIELVNINELEKDTKYTHIKSASEFNTDFISSDSDVLDKAIKNEINQKKANIIPY